MKGNLLAFPANVFSFAATNLRAQQPLSMS
jgi:hypothetical protein